MQRQPSPLTQPSPSTVDASPQHELGAGGAEATARRQDPARTRSTIACDKCRKSKTKCQNAGINTVCKACANSKRQCIYGPSAVLSPTVLRRESLVTDGDIQPRKRRKPLAPTSIATTHPKHGLGTLEDALDSPVLSVEVWAQLFAIYEKHFAIDFPFFHKRRFLDSIRRRQSVVSPTIKAETPLSTSHQYHPPLLLAFLTLTARHHERLVEQIDPKNPIATANFYAEATLSQMGTNYPGMPTLEKIQALLMLGYHEYTSVKGTEGWVKIGTAIRCAQALGYQWDADRDDPKAAEPPQGSNRLSEKDQFILRETQRRALWSCCLMDRYMSWGKNRPSMIRIQELKKVQLICSDDSFTYGRKVRTRLLGEDNQEYEKRRMELAKSHGTHPLRQLNNSSSEITWEIGHNEADLSWYIQIVEHFGAISNWSSAGGRTQEGTTPPWDKSTTFNKLETKLKQLKNGLPEHLQLTPENTQDRVYNGSDKYVLIHTMYTLCTVWLYREYMAMAPWGISRPKGPLDVPLIVETPPTTDYWVEQAKVCFGACREYADLLHAVHSDSSNNTLVETPTVAFAAYTVAWSTIYCFYFPRMDPDGALATYRQPRADDVTRDFLARMAERYKMAEEWTQHLSRLQKHFRVERTMYKKVGGVVGASPQSSSSDGGGGLKEYALRFEKSHKSFGTVRENDNDEYDDEDIGQAGDTKLPRDNGSEERSEPATALATKSEKREPSLGRCGTPAAPQTSEFTPVNMQQSVGMDSQQIETARVLPTGIAPGHGEHYSQNLRDVDSVMPSHDQPLVSPTTSYPLNPTGYPQTGLATGRGVQEPVHGQGHLTNPVSFGEPIHYWLTAGTPHEVKNMIEVNGASSCHNFTQFDSIMTGDGIPWDATLGYPTSFAVNGDPNTVDMNQPHGWYQQDGASNAYPYNPA